jgi:hypothetical protein
VHGTARGAAPLTRRRTGMHALFGPWVLLLAGCVPGDYHPYRSYSYDPYYRPYSGYRDHRDRNRHHKREHREAAPPKPPAPVGRPLGDALRRGR